MHITNLNKVKKTIPNMQGAEKLYKQIPISKEDGSPNFSFRVFTIEPGGHTPFHNHPFEHLNYIIEGHGEVVQKNGSQSLEKGDFILIMPDEVHQYRNNSDKSFVMICAVPKEYE
jgi:quercetin dioxygenase-like cupin family protein